MNAHAIGDIPLQPTVLFALKWHHNWTEVVIINVVSCFWWWRGIRWFATYPLLKKQKWNQSKS